MLGEGNAVTVDVGVRLDGWCSDSAWTFPVGEVEGRRRAPHRRPRRRTA
ncbi:MAG: M24 family metallopeptidase [Gemmatimonadaceae bacterium]